MQVNVHRGPELRRSQVPCQPWQCTSWPVKPVAVTLESLSAGCSPCACFVPYSRLPQAWPVSSWQTHGASVCVGDPATLRVQTLDKEGAHVP